MNSIHNLFMKTKGKETNDGKKKNKVSPDNNNTKSSGTKIILNVGGHIQPLSTNFLKEAEEAFPDSIFAKLSRLSPEEISSLKGENEWIFLDRNSQLFQILYRFLEKVFEMCPDQTPERLLIKHTKSTNSITKSPQRPKLANSNNNNTNNLTLSNNTVAIPNLNLPTTPRGSLDFTDEASRWSTTTLGIRNFEKDSEYQIYWNHLVEQLSLLQKFRLEKEIEFFGIDLLVWSVPNMTTITSNSEDLLRVSRSDVTPIKHSGKNKLHNVFKPVKYKNVDITYFQYHLNPQVNVKLYGEQLSSTRTTMNDNMLLIAGLCPETPAFVLTLEVESDLTIPFWKDDPSVTLIDALCIFRDVAHGLSALHRSQLVHGHLHPSNIFVKSGSDHQWVAKIGYFGEYKNYDPKERIFQAPEVQNTPRVGPTSDIFSWAMCVIASFWPKFLENNPSLEEITKKINAENKIPAPQASGHPPQFSERFRHLLLECLNICPENRPYLLGFGNNSFTSTFRDIVLGYSIRKEIGQQFWNKYFPRQQTVKDTDFFQSFFDYLPYQNNSAELSKETATRYLKAILGDPWERKQETTEYYKITDFGRMMDTFGPLDNEFYERLRDRFDFSGFYSICSRQYAENQLESGSFMIRLSSSEWGTRGSYVYSIRDSEERKFKHKRFLWSASSKSFSCKEQISASNLQEYVLLDEDLSQLRPMQANFHFG